MFASKDTLLTRPSGYNIARSVRLRSSASAYLNRTPSVAGNRNTWTWSAWVKRGKLSYSSAQLFASRPTASPYALIYFANDDTFQYDDTSGLYFKTNAVFRDPAAWYHLVIAIDTTQATNTNRIKVYVNGVQQTFATATYPVQNFSTQINTATQHDLASALPNTAEYFDGYLTEINFIDGQALTPSSFGSTNAVTGVWQPAKYTGTYGTNGFYLNFSNNASTTTLGYDTSGNSNNWTTNNISLTSGSTYDSMTDVPTLTSATVANYCVLNPLEKYSGLTIADGNLKVTASDNTSYGAAGTLAVSSGKWYYEAIFSVASVNNQAMGFVTTNNNVQTAQWAGNTGMFMCGNFVSGTAIHVGVNGSYTQVSTTLPSANSYLVCAIDYDNGKAWFGTTTSSGGAVTWYPASTGGTVGDPAAGTNPTITFSTTYPIRPYMGSYGAGANWIANFGQRPFITTQPTGFVALNTYNLPASTITNGATVMAATTFTSVSGTNIVVNTVNGVGFKPDLVWIKARSNVQDHYAVDSVRSGSALLRPNQTNAESSASYWIDSFNSNGFTTNTAQLLSIGYNYVAWQWQAGQGSSSSNTNGSITSTVSVGATQGFSVVTYTGNGSSSATVGHGLGVTPSMIIVKARSGGSDWETFHTSLGASYGIRLNTTAAKVAASSTAGGIISTSPTSTTFGFTAGTTNVNNANENGVTFVAYCFAAVAGYSAFGSYTGNGSTDGPFVFTGFRPRFILVKSSSGAFDWHITDTSRSTYNQADTVLFPNSSAAESNGGGYYYDLLSNGFKCRNLGSATNGSGATYIFAAFAESPFKTSLAR